MFPSKRIAESQYKKLYFSSRFSVIFIIMKNYPVSFQPNVLHISGKVSFQQFIILLSPVKEKGAIRG